MDIGGDSTNEFDRERCTVWEKFFCLCPICAWDPSVLCPRMVCCDIDGRCCDRDEGDHSSNLVCEFLSISTHPIPSLGERYRGFGGDLVAAAVPPQLSGDLSLDRRNALLLRRRRLNDCRLDSKHESLCQPQSGFSTNSCSVGGSLRRWRPRRCPRRSRWEFGSAGTSL